MQIRTRDQGSLTKAAGLRRGIGAALLLLGLLAAVSAIHSGYQSVEKLWAWTRHPADVVGIAGAEWVEVEVATEFLPTVPNPNVPEYAVPYEAGNSRLLVPRRPFAVYRLWTSADLLQDPGDPDSLELLSWVGLLTPVVGPLLLIPLLLGVWQGVRAGHWGEDVTRSATEPTSRERRVPNGSPRAASSGSPRPVASGSSQLPNGSPRMPAADSSQPVPHGSPRAEVPTGLLAAIRWRRSERGRWVPTPEQIARVQSGRSEEEPLRETVGSLWGAIFWCGILVLLGLSIAPAALGARSLTGLLAIGLLLPIATLFTFVIHAMVEVRTRSITWNAEGITDDTFFRIRRIPWSEVGSLELVNVNEDAQRRWDRTSRKRGSRPTRVEKYLLADRSGRVMLRLDPAMRPSTALDRLREAVATRLGESGNAHYDAHGGHEAGDARESPKGMAARSQVPDGGLGDADWDPFPEMAAERARHKQRSARSNRVMVLGMTAAMLPFILGTGYSCWKTLSFLLLAERAEGTVVEIATEGAPSLMVEYKTAEGESRLEESGGSDFYSDFSVGDPIRVFYKPGDPEAVRLDLFLENWLVPILLGGVTVMVLLPVLLLSGVLRRRSH